MGFFRWICLRNPLKILNIFLAFVTLILFTFVALFTSMDESSIYSKGKQPYFDYLNNIRLTDSMASTHKDKRSENVTECTMVKQYRFPHCKENFQRLQRSWKEYCYSNYYGVTGSNCSILQYLSEVAHVCPRVPHRAEMEESSLPHQTEKIEFKTNVAGLLKKLSSPRLGWLRQRILGMWNEWKEVGNKIGQLYTRKLKRKRVSIFPASIVYQPWILDFAGRGGPLGELVQWTDLITSVYILGFDVDVFFNMTNLKSVLVHEDEYSCIPKKINERDSHDIIFTDINGVTVIKNVFGEKISQKLNCKYRILDSFGTEAEYNFKKYTGPRPKGQSPWGGMSLLLPQFMTLFPHSPDNTFLGFIAGFQDKTKSIKNDLALIYGKKGNYYEGLQEYLDVAHEFFELHGTAIGGDSNIPDYVINHGPVNATTINNLLKKSKVFLGLGFPYEGPGPLEAAAHGAIFINPKYKVKKNKLTEEFFGDKPTKRKLSSQCPYMEDFVGEPYVYTVDISNKTELRRIFTKIKAKKDFEPYLPLEFSNVGLVQRVHAFLEYQDFCSTTAPNWPPLKNRKVVLSNIGESCTEACKERGLICENTYFESINNNDIFPRMRINCTRMSSSSWTHAPSYDPHSGVCYTQNEILSYSCSGDLPPLKRICPCRDFIKGQVALCNDCH